MTKSERDKRLGKLGKAVAFVLKIFETKFHGNVRFNIKDGRLVSFNIDETLRV